ncbi:hypothetical protein SBA4_7290001 [Candidatus Sulfopaludibacter sp. SbA4]|nr:hypothetical protein SBA4_7290001 [Candidatus Sulfopaludibacter sp. SbA4]
MASERNGRWGKAIAVPGLAALNTGRDAAVWSVSCASAGNCAAGGYYTGRHQNTQGFVAVERNGRWGTAIVVPGLAALNTGGFAAVSSLSCPSPGNCAAGGFYARGSRQEAQVFVASERNGAWGKAIAVPGLAALNTGSGDLQMPALSCASAGNCAVGGIYSDRSHNTQGFVASEDNGVWGTAIQVPGLGALNKGGFAEVSSLSCPSPGNCAAGGDYTDRAGNSQGFVTLSRSKLGFGW